VSSGRDKGNSREESGGQLVNGERLAELRRERGLTQELLAGRAGVSVALVQKLERGARQSAQLSILSALAGVLKVPVSVMLGNGHSVTPESAGQPVTAAQRPPDYLPAEVLDRPDFARACAEHDLGAMFTIAVGWGGAGFSASHIARRCEMSIGRVGDYMKGRMRAQKVGIFARVSDGLHIPGTMLGIGRRPWESPWASSKPPQSDVRPPEGSVSEKQRSPDYLPGGTLTVTERSTDMMEFADKVRSLLSEQRMSLRELARASHYHVSHLSNVLNGRKRLTAQVAKDLDNLLGARGELTAFVSDPEKPSQNSDVEIIQHPHEGDQFSPEKEAEEQMERRNLLRSLAALGIAVSPLTEALETIRGGFGKAFGYDDRNHVDDWEETVIQYGYTYLSDSPVQLISDLAMDVLSIRSIMAELGHDHPEYRAWCRIGGMLSTFIAKTLSNLGHARDARQWWNMAQHVTDTSGDRELSMFVRGNRIIHGLYEHRSPQVLLRQISEALEFDHGYSCSGLAEVSACRAQVLVMSGNSEEAVHELCRTENILGQLPSAVTMETSSIMGWGEDRLRYTEAWVYAYTGDERRTDNAARRAIQLYPAIDIRSLTQIKLIQAYARIKAGDISEGIRQAQGAYEALPADHRITIVDGLANQVLSGVPVEERAHQGVAAYRELISSSPQKAIES
jgi:transcriptional regulator with XRE-family HTH domain